MISCFDLPDFESAGIILHACIRIRIFRDGIENALCNPKKSRHCGHSDESRTKVREGKELLGDFRLALTGLFRKIEVKRVIRGHEMGDAVQNEFDIASVRFSPLGLELIEHFPEEHVNGLAA